jgi:hypothetical protein
MNRRSILLISAIYAVLLSVGDQLHAQTWVTHSTFSGGARTVLLAPTPSATPPPALVGGSGIVAVGSDGSSTLLTGTGPDTCFRLGYDGFGGNLFAVGFSGATTGNWEVHESADGGGAWQLTDSFSLSPQFSSARGFASDGNGNVFVCGGAKDSSGYAYWIVRRRDALGNWKTVQDLSSKRSDSYASGMCVVNGTLFVVGQFANKWMVQRGSNLGGDSVTWDTGYTWVPSKTGSAQANAVAADSAGNIHVFGINNSAAFGYEALANTAVLQKSSDGGNTWVTASTFKPAGSSINRAHDMAFDASGNLFLASAANFSYSPKPRTVVSAWKWVVYRQEVATGVWTATFPFGVDPSQGDSLAKGISTDTAGNVFVTGPFTDSNGNYGTAVQRLQY